MTCPKCKGKLELLFVSWQCPNCDLRETKPEVKQDTAQSKLSLWVSLLGQDGITVPHSTLWLTDQQILALSTLSWDTSRFKGALLCGVAVESNRGHRCKHNIRPIVADGNELLIGNGPFHLYVLDWVVGS